MQPQKIGGLSYNGAINKAGYSPGYSFNSQSQTSTPSPAIGGLTVKPFGEQPNTVRNPLTGSGQSNTIPTGNTQGMMSTPPKPDTTYTATTTTNGKGGTSTKPTPNPSVLAQQQAMNKLGAGLVEDGLAGPLTQAAVSSGKYSSTGTPVKTETSNTGNSGTISGVIPKTETPPKPPADLNISGQAPEVKASGAQTQNEIETQKRLMELSQKGSPEYQAAQTAYQKAIQDYNTSVQNQARSMGANYSEPIPLNFQQGRGQVLQTQYAAQQAGLGGLVSGASNALGAANTQQGLQTTAGQGAYTGAQTQAGRATTAGTSVLNAVQPITGVPYGTQTIQPGLLGQNGGQTGQVQPNDPYYKTLQNYAQMAASGQYGAISSSVTGNAVLNDQMNQMAKAINPNYNPVTSSAQSGITTAQTQNVATMTASYQSATNLGSQLKDLISTYGVNPADLNAANIAIQKVAQNTSSAQYQALNNLVTDIVATYSSILTPGSTTDTARATAASLLNDTASGKSIMTTLNNLDDQAKAKIAGQTTSYGANPGAPSGGGTSTSGFGWNG